MKISINLKIISVLFGLLTNCVLCMNRLLCGCRHGYGHLVICISSRSKKSREKIIYNWIKKQKKTKMMMTMMMIMTMEKKTEKKIVCLGGLVKSSSKWPKIPNIINCAHWTQYKEKRTNKQFKWNRPPIEIESHHFAVASTFVRSFVRSVGVICLTYSAPLIARIIMIVVVVGGVYCIHWAGSQSANIPYIWHLPPVSTWNV